MKDSLYSLTDSNENAKYFEEAAQQVFVCEGKCTIEIFKAFVDKRAHEKRSEHSRIWQVASTYRQFNKRSLQHWLYRKQKKFQEKLIAPQHHRHCVGFQDEYCNTIRNHEPGILCMEWASRAKQYFLVTFLAAGTRLNLELFQVERINMSQFKVTIPIVNWLNPDVITVNEMGHEMRKMTTECFAKTSRRKICHLIEAPFCPNMSNPHRLVYNVDLKNCVSIFKVLFIKNSDGSD